jgi:hypothetical protein
MIDEIADAVPAQYNDRSTLKVDLSQTGPLDFELFSPAAPRGNAPSATN